MVFILSVFFLLAGCSVASPDFIVKGIKVESALHSLREMGADEGKEQKLPHYVEHLRDNHAPGFAWDKYWQAIADQALYQNMTERELNHLFSLNDVSCRPENLDSFVGLLLETVKADQQKILIIRPELKRLRTVCSSSFSDSSFKSLVWFLARERAKKELGKIQSVPSAPLIQYPYTKELQALLLEEWQVKPSRAWSDIVTVVDKAFWSDVRWLNLYQGNTEHLKQTLKLEWSLYQSLSHPEQDILLLFGAKNVMADRLALFGYEKYLSVPGALDWLVLSSALLQKYPIAPENGNVKTLMSLFSRSCQARDFPSFSRLMEQWDISELPSAGFCLNKGALVQMTKDEEFTSPSVLAESVQQVFSRLPVLDSVMYLLALYDKEKHLRSTAEWESFLKSFSEKDWVELMALLRKNNDRQSIMRILDMHGRVYRGEVAFLAEDILSVMLVGKESIHDMLENGYSASYMNHPHVLESFWKKVKEEKKEVQGVSLFESGYCDYPYIQQIYRFFSESGKEDLLLERFRFDRCPQFILDFRETEWDNLVLQFRMRGVYTSASTGGSADSDLVWWMARVLSLPYSLTLSTKSSQAEGDEWLSHVFATPYMDFMGNSWSVREAVSQLNLHEWSAFFRIMIDSLQSPESQTHKHVFRYVSDIASMVYPLALQQAVCGFFAQKDSHKLVEQYYPAFIWGLFYQVDWSQFSHTGGRNKLVKRVCSDLVSPKRINALLFVLSRAIFDELEAKSDISTDIYAEQVKKQADQLIHLFDQVRPFDDRNTTAYRVKKSLSNLRTFYTGDEYDMEKGYISDSALMFYFSGLVAQKLQSVAKNAQELKDMIRHYQETGPSPLNPFDEVYRSQVQEFLALSSKAIAQ